MSAYKWIITQLELSIINVCRNIHDPNDLKSYIKIQQLKHQRLLNERRDKPLLL